MRHRWGGLCELPLSDYLVHLLEAHTCAESQPQPAHSSCSTNLEWKGLGDHSSLCAQLVRPRCFAPEDSSTEASLRHVCTYYQLLV